MKVYQLQIENNQPINQNQKIFKITLLLNPQHPTALPGQFFQVQIPSQTFILRRPFSVFLQYSVKNNRYIDILYQVKGPFSSALSQKQYPDTLHCQGPLGKTFPLNIPKNARLLFLAQEISIASLFFLIQYLSPHSSHLSVVLFAASPQKIVCPAHEFKKLSVQPITYVYHKPSQLTSFLNSFDQSNLFIFASGSYPFLDSISRWSNSHHIPCQILIKTFFACGYGVCLSCVVPLKNGQYQLACTHGPVFDAHSVDFSKLIEYHPLLSRQI